jgi:phosphotransferase system enzyme I (PtsI)
VVVRQELNGTHIAPGVGVGSVFVALTHTKTRIPLRRIEEDDADHAWKLLRAARHAALKELEEIQTATAKELGLQDAAIYAAQAAVLQDPEALKDLRKWVYEELMAPESAIQALLDKFGKLFDNLEGGDMKSWAADLRDPWNSVLRELSEGDVEAARSGGPGLLVLVAEELTPTLVVSYPREKIAAIVCSRGGRYSHGAVLARSFGIPTVTGLDAVDERVRSGQSCVVFGDAGQVVLNATAKEREAALTLAAERAHVRVVLASAAKEAGHTKDGTKVKVQVNIESPRDLDMFDLETVNGVGLFRTEFAYMERPSFPSVEEQQKIYASVLGRFRDKPVVFRTLDIGGDKPLRYFQTPEEGNPALGWRGLRLSLKWQDLFLMQLQALRDCRHDGQVHIMLPMVTNVEEIQKAKDLLLAISGDGELDVRFGVMIEVPAAAMALPDIVEEVDFISVGTNDLTQYLFAVDRDNPWVSDLYQPYHPANLRVLRYIARICREAGVPATVCGEMAGQPAGAFFLTGVGFEGLSMSPLFVPEIKALLREVDIESLQKAAYRAARASTAKDAMGILEAETSSAWQKVVESVGSHKT